MSKVSPGRRNFLKMTVAGAAGIALTSNADSVFAAQSAGTSPGPGNKWPGRVVINFNKTAIGTAGADQTVIIKMVDDAIKSLTDQTTVAAAWKAVFPSTLNASSKIAIKINILNAGLPAPHPFSVMGIVQGLMQMDFNGTKFPAANITIYDMNNGNSMDSAGYTAARFPGVTLVKDSTSNYTDGAKTPSGTTQPYAKTLNAANFLINVFSPRGHSTYASGFSLGFKSHYGTYPTTYHDTNTPPYLRNLNCTGPVYNKTVLSVCSGIYGMNEGNGPTGSADNYSTYSKTMDSTSTATSPTTIIMSTDPISCEMQAIKIMRINNKGAYATSNMPDYLKASGGNTVTGWSPIYNIGTIDESKMDIRKIINGSSATSTKPVAGSGMANGSAGIVAHRINGHNSTFVEFKLPQEHTGNIVAIEIYNARGTLVRNFSHKVSGILNHFSWDEKDAQGSPVSKGTYIVRLNAGSIQASTPCAILR